MAKISFPHMGNSPMVFELLLKDLGNQVVLPDQPNVDTLAKGTLHAPEFACLPFKIVLGTMIQCLEKGAEVLVTSGGVGPCRAGHYCTVQEKILKDLGYEFEMIVLEPPLLGIWDFLKKVKRLNAAKHSWVQVYRLIKKAWQKLIILDNLEKLSHRIRPREACPGETTRVYQRALELMRPAETPDEIKAAGEQAVALMQGIRIDPDKQPLKVGIVGEIYVLLEPASNFFIEETLGYLGVEVERSIFLTGWTQDNTLPKSMEQHETVTAKEAAKSYLEEMIGGHGQDSIGHTVIYAKRGFDGVIQLAPFTCIPEIVAKTILPRVSMDWNIPVLSIFLDELTGKAGLQTRLEAFVDLMERRRRKLPQTGLLGPVTVGSGQPETN